MKRLPKLVLIGALIWSTPAFAQDRWPQEERKPEAPPLPSRPVEDRSADLWYGAPGIRPGGDLLVPILDLIRKPSGLLDFRPRKVERFLPDRDTAECFRERR